MTVLDKLVCNHSCTGCELNITISGDTDVCDSLKEIGMLIVNDSEEILLSTKPEGRWVCSYCYINIELGEKSMYTPRRVGRFDTEEQCNMHCYSDHEIRDKAKPMKLEEGVE